MTQHRPLALEWSEGQGRACLRISGWTEKELSELGGLTAAELAWRLVILPSALLESGADSRTVPPIAGSFRIDGDAVSFLPRFPFVDGASYSLLVDGGAEVHTIRRPAPEAAPTTEVVAIYPSGGEVPLNLLKVYVHFSAPMSEGWGDRAVRVCREDNGEPLVGVFLPMEPELWDPERQRLTMLLDPGRIKRGLVPNQEAGYPLDEGVPVRITIGSDFRDAAGHPLRDGAEKCYQVGEALRARIDPAGWDCRVPPASSVEPLVVEFDRPLDHAMLQHCLWVCDGDGVPLTGQVSVGPCEKSWSFQPEKAWREGRHQLMVDSSLEDLAGNSLSRVFDRDVTEEVDSPEVGRRVAVDFNCTPSPGRPQ